MKPTKITLEQWQTFKAVVDEGSFAKAAEALNKSQSTVSYAIAKLEEQLPTPVLTIEGRKAVLTEEGKVMYRRASQLLDLALNVEQTATSLAEGWETQLTIDIESIVPIDRVLQALQIFMEKAPQTRITLLETTLSGTVETLLERRADLVLTGQIPPGFLGTHITQVKLIPVAHANHPLCREKKSLSQQDLQQHRQIVVRDSGTKRNLDAGWLGSEQRLTLSHFSQTLQALIAGMGFSFVPEHLIKKELSNGTLKKLNLMDDAERYIPIQLVKSSPDNEGAAIKEMALILKQVFK